MAGALHAPGLVNGIAAPSPAETEELYSQLLRLRDVVIAGKHASLKLPADAIERLKASLLPFSDAQAPASLNASAINGTAFATNQAQLSSSLYAPSLSGLPGLSASSGPPSNGAGPAPVKPAHAAGLDPIFLEKSEVVVRAEGQLKRQRLDRELQAQVEQRKHSSRDRDPGADAPSPIDIDHVLRVALERVKPVSGLKEEVLRPGSAASSSFDENDYYSSQVQSEWSSQASERQGSDRAAGGAFTADFEPLEGPSTTFVERSSHVKEPAIPGSSGPKCDKYRPHVYTNEPEDVYELDDNDDDDDDYAPPDATAVESLHPTGASIQPGQITPPEDDNSDYEPGEITDSNYIPTPQQQVPQNTQPSPRVPVIRNHLTHIAAPQPNRVSPLATAKHPSIELELVNGRPEVVQKPQHHLNHVQSRASTASPSGPNGATSSGKKKRTKKRKARDVEPNHGQGRAKKRRDRNAPPAPEARTFVAYEEQPYIKPEPVSPPPFGNVLDIPQYGQQYVRQVPDELEIVAQRPAPQVQYVYERPRSAQQFQPLLEQPRPAVQYQPVITLPTVASPRAHQPIQRDNQDLRRVASLHYAQRLPSPPQMPTNSPAELQYIRYGDRQPPQPTSPHDQAPPRYQEPPPREASPYVRAERSRSPPQVNEYRSAYGSRAASPPPVLPPPAAPPRRIVVDQHGNQYYAADPAPAPAPLPVSKASVPSQERRSVLSIANEGSYAPLPPQNSQYIPQQDQPMAPPPLRASTSSRRPQQPASEQPIHQAGSNGHAIRPVQDYHRSSAYPEQPTSPVYQSLSQRYEQQQQMPPPPQQPQSQSQRTALEQAAPIYVSSRSYSTRPPEEPGPPLQQPSYLRHASVAPVQYVHASQAQAPPPQQVRTGSVAPVQYVRQTPQIQEPRAGSVAPVQYVRHSSHQHPREQGASARAVSVMPAPTATPAGLEYAGQQQQPQRVYSQAPQAVQQAAPQAPPPTWPVDSAKVRYVDQFGNEVFPREVRQVGEYR